MSENKLKLIVGLGNPGPEYDTTRHNAGFRVIDRLGTIYGANLAIKRNLLCHLGKVTTASKDVLLAKPITFMNHSGEAVSRLISWYKLPLTDVLVVHDDVSLPLGRLRFQRGGGAGGQHGLESIIEVLSGARDFDRLKMGVGPDPGGSKRKDYVLSPVPQKERELFEKCIEIASEAVIFWLDNSVFEAMNQFNGLNLAEESSDGGS